MNFEYNNKLTNQKTLFYFSLTLFLLVIVLLSFLFQGSRGIWQPDEGYYVGTAVTMLKDGNLLIPRLGETIFLEKPPFVYWSIIAGIKLFGYCEFGVRFFNAVFYTATVLIVSLLGYHLSGKKQYAIVAGLIYATMIIPFIASNFVTPDTTLVLWTTLSMLFFWKSAEPNARHITLWKLLLCAAVGLGFLTKGPAVLLPCGGMFVFLAARKQIIKYFWTWWALAGFVIFCIVGLSWYTWISVKLPGAFSYFIDNQIWGRLVSDKYNRNPGISRAFLYLPILIFGSMPWSIILLQQRNRLKDTIFKKSWWIDLPNHPEVLFLLTWFLVPILVLCFASSKLGFYVLPVFPALALAVMKFWTEKIPSISLTQIKDKIRIFIRPAVLTGIWLVILPGVKFALAYYPTQKDARALWQQIKPYFPNENYEIITVDEHADGLLFYGATEVENVTKKNSPYPTFSMPEHILKELKDIAVENHCFFFLVREADDIAEVKNVLTKHSIAFSEITLPYKRAMLICKPSDNSRTCIGKRV